MLYISCELFRHPHLIYLFSFSPTYPPFVIFLDVTNSAVGKRKFDGGHQNQGDPKRRYGSGIGNGGPGNGGNWGSQPLPQQPLGANGEQWYTDTYPSWS